MDDDLSLAPALQAVIEGRSLERDTRPARHPLRRRHSRDLAGALSPRSRATSGGENRRHLRTRRRRAALPHSTLWNGGMFGSASRSLGRTALLGAAGPGSSAGSIDRTILRATGPNSLCSELSLYMSGVRASFLCAPVSKSTRPKPQSLSENQNAARRQPSLLDPFPEKPPGMHWRSRHRLCALIAERFWNLCARPRACSANR
jgi:hypothetical protein